MVRREVKRLFKLTLSVVCENLKSAINTHQLQNNSCGPCTAVPTQADTCPVIAELKHYFNLPPDILNIIFDKLKWNLYDAAGREYLTLMTTYCFLLENPELSVHYFWNVSHPEEQLFLRTYGKYVTTLVCKSRDSVHEEPDFWRSGFRYTRNLQCLNLAHVSTSLKNDLFEYIGLECVQIKEILFGFSSGINGRDEIKDFDPVKFRKLCFRTDFDGNEVKTECCNTLEEIDILYDDKSQPINDIVALLLQNMNKLKTLGPYFYADLYLEFLERSDSGIFKTSLQKINLDGPTVKYTLFLLKMFCPEMRVLNAKSICNEKFINLNSSFPNLESLRAKITSEEVPAKMITVPMWSSLKKLELDFYNNSCVVDLSVFAEQMPALEKLQFGMCHQLKWDSVTRFKALQSADFQLNKLKNISWIISFSATIVHFCLHVPDRYLLDKNSLNYLLTADFPKLRYININNVYYDFDFLFEVVQKCPSLEGFSALNLIYPFSDDVSDKSFDDEENLFEDLNKFVKDNNYKCEFGYEFSSSAE